MANLRANRIISTTGSNAITGSVEFDGTGDYLNIPNNTQFEVGEDFTFETWIYRTSLGSLNTIYSYLTAGTTLYGLSFILTTTGIGIYGYNNGDSTYDALLTISGVVTTNEWHHVAVVRSSNTWYYYIDGVLQGSGTMTSFSYSGTPTFYIGYQNDNYANSFAGYLSNYRILKGTALYTSNFIPPTSKLINLPGTVLLCCQDNESVTTEVTGKTITANGDPTATRFTPSVGSDGSVEFAGPTTINTENYFYLPTGTTEQQFPIFPGGNVGGSARGVFGGGFAPGDTNTIDYITISSTGDAQDFGDLTQARYASGVCSSSTRGVFSGGGIPTTYNIIDYVTILSTGNALDFGDLIAASQQSAGCSSSTRGIFGGGASAVNTIEYITISSTGNAQDFGDLTQARRNHAACASSTHGVFGGGLTPTLVNTIDYVIISTTGNAIDFGDLTQTRRGPAGCSSSTRGLFGGGYATPTQVNTVDYITIASTGNATYFGDLTQARSYPAACSSSTRGVFGGGYNPTIQNTIDYVTIASTGDAVDFGDLFQPRWGFGGCSNGHGGLG